MSAPKFKIGEVVYLSEPATLGELDAFRIGAIHQKSANTWIYQIFIEQKPPREQTVGDRIDLKESRNLFYDEGELLTLCEAVELAISNIQVRINRMQLIQDGCSATVGANPPPAPQIEPGAPLFENNSVVFIRASANIGFLESYRVLRTHKIPSSNEYMYELNLFSSANNTSIPVLTEQDSRVIDRLYFKERELITKCDAALAALNALDRKMVRLLGIKLALCTDEITGSGSN